MDWSQYRSIGLAATLGISAGILFKSWLHRQEQSGDDAKSDLLSSRFINLKLESTKSKPKWPETLNSSDETPFKFSSIDVDSSSLLSRFSWLAIAGGQCMTFAVYLGLQRRANDSRLFRYERRDVLSTVFQMKRAFSVFPGCPAANFFRAPLFAVRPWQFFQQLFSLSTKGNLLFHFITNDFLQN
jgi:hypothetical protein